MTVSAEFELDDRLAALRGAAADLAGQLRAHALAVDDQPGEVKALADLPAFDLIRALTTPLRFADGPLRIGRHSYPPGSCLDQAVCVLELAAGDAGALMTCPGPSLSGVLVDSLADERQQERFYRAVADGRTWTFFAVTEPGRGSDAGSLGTGLRRDPDGDTLRLHGVKRYIGNGARGRLGVVFGRTGPGPLSIRAALVETPADGFEAGALDLVGLRGAGLAELRFDGVAVPEDMLLGRHLPATRRGLWGAMRVFHQMRVQVAALALGTGAALVELVAAERPRAPRLDEFADRLAAGRRLVYAAAAALDADPDEGHRASVAKVVAAALGRETSRWAVGALDPIALVEQPLLEKWTRDVLAFEFMEGTTNIQRRHINRAYTRGLLPSGGARR